MWEPDYATAAELAAYLEIDDDLDDAQLALAVTAASRAVDDCCRRQFGVVDAAELRSYTARIDYERRLWVVDVDDLAVAPVSVTIAGDPVTVRTEPPNAVKVGRVWTLLAVTGGRQPCGEPYEVDVTAVWGWPAVPDTVKEATLLQAARFFKRRVAPFGVAGSPDQGSEMRLLARADPDVAFMLRRYARIGRVG